MYWPDCYMTDDEVAGPRYYPYYSDKDYIVFGVDEAVSETDADAFVVHHWNGWVQKFYYFGWRYRVKRDGFREEGYPLVGPVLPAKRVRVVI